MNALHCLLLALAGYIGFESLRAQSAARSEPVVIAGPADRLFREIVLDGPITNWWGRPVGELRTAAASGNADAELALARVLLSGPDRSTSFDEARQHIARAADGNQSQAQYLMGYLVLNPQPYFPGGEYVQDFGSAADWFELSAAGGSVRACYELAQLYNYGKLPRDYTEAERWYQKAAERGHVPSIRALVDLFLSNHTNADGSKFSADPAKRKQWQAVLEDQKRKMDSKVVQTAPTTAPAATRTPDPTPGPGAGLQPDQLAEMMRSLGPQELNRFKQALSNAMERGNLPELTAPSGKSPRVLLTEARNAEASAQTAAQWEVVLQRYGKVPRFPVTAEAREAAKGILRIYREARLDPHYQGPRPPLPFDPDLLPKAEERLQLAELLLRGNDFVPVEPWSATPWLLNLAREGNATAMRRIGELWKEGVGGTTDPAEAARWFARAAKAEAFPP